MIIWGGVLCKEKYYTKANKQAVRGTHNHKKCHVLNCVATILTICLLHNNNIKLHIFDNMPSMSYFRNWGSFCS